MEAIVSMAIVSAIMVIVFPFFGQVLQSDHQLEIQKGLQMINEMEASDNYEQFATGIQEFSGDGIRVRIITEQHKENPLLYHITTEFVNSKNKVVYSLTEFKYKP